MRRAGLFDVNEAALALNLVTPSDTRAIDAPRDFDSLHVIGGRELRRRKNAPEKILETEFVIHDGISSVSADRLRCFGPHQR